MAVRHTVQQGESVISLSEQYGLFAETIWDDPANAALRKNRPDMNVLLPGDVVVIPDKRPRLEKRETGARHKFRRKGIPALFRLQVYDMHHPRATQNYTLTVDGVAQTGVTTDQGVVEKFVPAASKTGELVIGPDNFSISLQFGHLDPATDLCGLQKRLNNIGYNCGPADGVINDKTRQAIAQFQREHKLTETGEPDQATIDYMEKIHSAAYAYPGPGGGA